MNVIKLEGSWNIFLGRWKQSCAKLLRDDQSYARGREKELIGRLQRRFGKSRDEVRRMLEGPAHHHTWPNPRSGK